MGIGRRATEFAKDSNAWASWAWRLGSGSLRWSYWWFHEMPSCTGLGNRSGGPRGSSYLVVRRFGVGLLKRKLAEKQRQREMDR